MRNAWMLPASVIVATVALIVSTGPANEAEPAASDAVGGGDPLSLRALVHYVDPDFGFAVAVPEGWTASVVAESEARRTMYEPGYAVGFESPRQGFGDPFADYLMIEILPGDESGLFETDGSRRRRTEIDGRVAWRDALRLPAAGVPGEVSHRDADRVGAGADRYAERSGAPDHRTARADALDLVVLQASMRGLGYTVGFFAVGEPSNAEALGDAFEAVLRTFRLPRAPFEVS